MEWSDNNISIRYIKESFYPVHYFIKIKNKKVYIIYLIRLNYYNINSVIYI